MAYVVGEKADFEKVKKVNLSASFCDFVYIGIVYMSIGVRKFKKSFHHQNPSLFRITSKCNFNDVITLPSFAKIFFFIFLKPLDIKKGLFQQNHKMKLTSSLFFTYSKSAFLPHYIHHNIQLKGAKGN